MQLAETYIAYGTIRVGIPRRDEQGNPKLDNQGRQIVDVRQYHHGEEVHPRDFTDPAFDPDDVPRMIRDGHLRLPAEVLPVEDLNAKLERLKQLEAENAALKAAVEQGSGGGRAADLLEQSEAEIAEAKATATSKGVKLPVR